MDCACDCRLKVLSIPKPKTSVGQASNWLDFILWNTEIAKCLTVLLYIKINISTGTTLHEQLCDGGKPEALDCWYIPEQDPHLGGCVSTTPFSVHSYINDVTHYLQGVQCM